MLYIFVSGRGHQNREEKTKRWHEGVAARVRSSESEFKNFFFILARNFLNVQDFKVVTKEVKRWKEGEQDGTLFRKGVKLLLIRNVLNRGEEK